MAQYLDLHYKGRINIGDYWKVGDTRKIHLNAMIESEGGGKHVAQNMAMLIIGIEHDDLAEPINSKTKAAITLQCREVLGDNGTSESDSHYLGTGQYANSPRRTWLNTIFISALPTIIQPLIKTVIKKNLANHKDNTAGTSTEDKAFFTSYPEMFGSASYYSYKGSVALEGKQYPYYSSNTQRKKYANNNGTTGSKEAYYWLRSPSSSSSAEWLRVNEEGKSEGASWFSSGLAPAFCL